MDDKMRLYLIAGAAIVLVVLVSIIVIKPGSSEAMARYYRTRSSRFSSYFVRGSYTVQGVYIIVDGARDGTGDCITNDNCRTFEEGKTIRFEVDLALIGKPSTANLRLVQRTNTGKQCDPAMIAVAGYGVAGDLKPNLVNQQTKVGALTVLPVNLVNGCTECKFDLCKGQSPLGNTIWFHATARLFGGTATPTSSGLVRSR